MWEKLVVAVYEFPAIGTVAVTLTLTVIVIITVLVATNVKWEKHKNPTRREKKSGAKQKDDSTVSLESWPLLRTLPRIIDFQFVVPAVNDVLDSIDCEGSLSDVSRDDALSSAMRSALEYLETRQDSGNRRSEYWREWRLVKRQS